MNAEAPPPPRMLPFVLLALLMPLVLGLGLFWLGEEYARWNELRVEAGQSYDRRALLTGIQSEMRAAETSQRGYVITGNPGFRTAYERSRQLVQRSFAQVDRAYRETMDHRDNVAVLHRIADEKFAEMDDVLDRYAAAGAGAARTRVTDGEGRRLMDRFQGEVRRIIEAERKVGDGRLATYNDRTRTIQRVMWLLLAISTCLIVLALYVLWRQRQAQYAVEMREFDAARRNRTILNSTIDPIIIVNPSGTIETMNSAAGEMLGYEQGSLARRDFDVISDIARGSGSFHERIGLVDGRLRTPYWTDRVVRHRDGRRLPVDIALGVMALPDGEHVVVSLRDINERKRVERLKDELISTVSHELRTPLTSIVGALGLLRMDPGRTLPETAAGLVAIAENNAQRLIRLVNDMLDVDRMDSGKLRLTMQAVDLRNVVMRACEDNSGLTGQGDAIHFTVPDAALMIQGDEERLIQVVTNLLSNALKVTPAGGQVTVGVVRSRDGRRAVLHVDDQGPGIPPEFRSRIFGRFERAVNHEGTAGTGLGLAIAREIVVQHGGDIHFEDRPGGGTRFVVSLPVAMLAATAHDIDGDPAILICEGNPAIARALQAQLSQDGYACRIVTNAQAARAAIAANGFSLLLLDMALDDGDAFEFAREVRRLKSAEKLSILMVSPGENDDGSPLSLDLVDWLDKPIDPFRLKAAVRTALRHSAVERPTVLHLDDDQDTLDITASALQGDAHILKALTLAEARALLRTHTPHLAILDVHLEEGIGLDLLPDLVDGNGVAIPTIVYSAHDVDIEISGQIDAVLVKSRTSLPDLKATVRRVVTTRHVRGEEG